MATHSHAHQVVSLLDEEPDLGADLAPEEFELARSRALANVIELRPPEWDASEVCAQADAGWLGLFILDGLLIRRVTVGRRSTCELLGPTDVFRPWDADADYAPLPLSRDLIVVKRTRVAVLDSSFALRTARWPQLTGRIVGRVAARARYQSMTHAVGHLPRADARLLILFWLLAERWGRVGPDGVYVTLPLTHEILAMLVGAHRPTVTIALQRLNRAGFLIRERSDRWLLTRRGIDALENPESVRLIVSEPLSSEEDPPLAQDGDPARLLVGVPPATS
ncbi:MAG: helix-turn-helix domain-containing protein [Solirubrobacteraceae bacterium]